jgi:hypothetical protein
LTKAPSFAGLRRLLVHADVSRYHWSYNVMINRLGQSLYPKGASDSSLRTESNGSNQSGPEHDGNSVWLPYAPKRARLKRGGPPVYLGLPVVSDLPRFLVAADSIDNPEPSRLAAKSRNLLPCLTSPKPNPEESVGRSNSVNIPALRLDIEGFEASLRRLKRQIADLGWPHADPVSPLHRHPTAESMGGNILGVGRSTDLVPPALVRAAQRKKASRGPLPILVPCLVLVAAIAYFITGSAPPPHAAGEATAGLEATIGPPVPALQNEMRPTEGRNDDSDLRTSPSGEASSSAALRSEGRHSDIGAPKQAVGSSAASQARSGAAPDSRKSTRANHGSRQCAKRCTGSSCLPSSGCSNQKNDSTRAQVTGARKGSSQANTNPQTGVYH